VCLEAERKSCEYREFVAVAKEAGRVLVRLSACSPCWCYHTWFPRPQGSSRSPIQRLRCSWSRSRPSDHTILGASASFDRRSCFCIRLSDCRRRRKEGGLNEVLKFACFGAEGVENLRHLLVSIPASRPVLVCGRALRLSSDSSVPFPPFLPQYVITNSAQSTSSSSSCARRRGGERGGRAMMASF
jgi:hypothetical protein